MLAYEGGALKWAPNNDARRPDYGQA